MVIATQSNLGGFLAIFWYPIRMVTRRSDNHLLPTHTLFQNRFAPPSLTWSYLLPALSILDWGNNGLNSGKCAHLFRAHSMPFRDGKCSVLCPQFYKEPRVSGASPLCETRCYAENVGLTTEPRHHAFSWNDSHYKMRPKAKFCARDCAWPRGFPDEKFGLPERIILRTPVREQWFAFAVWLRSRWTLKFRILSLK